MKAIRANLLLAASVVSLIVCAVLPAHAQLRVVRVAVGESVLDVDAPLWANAPATDVTMLPQTVTTPMNAAPAIPLLHVRAAHDGQQLAVRIDWDDATLSNRIVVDQFGDQVAIQFPEDMTKGVPAPMMGNPGGRVRILQWRAAFQADIEHGRPNTTRDLYPNALVDVYPDEVLRATDARPYMGAVGVANPITYADRSPVLEQIAEGWGTLTVDRVQQADGRGAWKDGHWQVVITHPLAAGHDELTLSPGGMTMAGFAVWDGGSREVGPRKAWASWIPVQLDP